ncbi:suppressor of fused domain protein [Fusobacterium sp.]|uniref:suppressor of fused domain protein n=1 Tax=Fusobacterium sp. TaxID=68766 RepID=UPI0029014DFB|nr:suppressor of fused domain protein [Fusobacterium sp.]MDU1910713.1 suppressor of fused domain protein [Fusobacterium sp.]
MFSDMFKKKKVVQKKQYPEVYEEKEIDILEEYIIERYGNFTNVFHEIVSPDIHVDIAIIPPRKESDYYTLITMGMGAHKMNVPKELSKYNLERAELIINLPKDWNLQNTDEEIWYWPLRWLKILARLPIEQNTWLGFGHTVPSGEPVAEDVLFNCMLLIDDDSKVTVSKDKDINFYTVVPIYEEEMQYKFKNQAEGLLELFEKSGIPYPPVVDKKRKNLCKED